MEAQAINSSPLQQTSTVELGPSSILSAKSVSFVSQRMQIDTVTLTKPQREKLEELSKWRIDASAIQFSKDNADLHGGFAAVCRASVTDTQDDGSGCDPQASWTGSRVAAREMTD